MVVFALGDTPTITFYRLSTVFIILNRTAQNANRLLSIELLNSKSRITNVEATVVQKPNIAGSGKRDVIVCRALFLALTTKEVQKREQANTELEGFMQRSPELFELSLQLNDMILAFEKEHNIYIMCNGQVPEFYPDAYPHEPKLALIRFIPRHP